MNKKCISQLIARNDIIKKFMDYKIDKNLTTKFVQEYFDRTKILY